MTFRIGSLILCWCMISAHMLYGQTGCDNYSAGQCVDPMPVLNFGGTYTESDSSFNTLSTWTITQTGGGTVSSSGTVSGSVDVVPASTGCPHIAYTVSGSFTSSAVIDGTAGATTFTWTAANPNPSTSCGGYTPVQSRTYQGTLANKNNDNSSGNGTGTNGQSITFAPGGPIHFIRTSAQQPTGETIQDLGWSSSPGYGTKRVYAATLKQSAPIAANLFTARQVFETTPDPRKPSADTCYTKGVQTLGSVPFGPFDGVTGSGWNVGYSTDYSGNTYGPDSIGWPTSLVQWYQQHLSAGQFPCGTSFTQQMNIVRTSGSNPDASFIYITHAITVKITSKTGALPNAVQVSRQ